GPGGGHGHGRGGAGLGRGGLPGGGHVLLAGGLLGRREQRRRDERVRERAADGGEGVAVDRDQPLAGLDLGRRQRARLGHAERGDRRGGRHGQLHGVHDQRLLDAGAGGAAAGGGQGDGRGRAGAGLGPRELPGRGHVLLAGRLLGRREQQRRHQRLRERAAHGRRGGSVDRDRALVGLDRGGWVGARHGDAERRDRGRGRDGDLRGVHEQQLQRAGGGAAAGPGHGDGHGRGGTGLGRGQLPGRGHVLLAGGVLRRREQRRRDERVRERAADGGEGVAVDRDQPLAGLDLGRRQRARLGHAERGDRRGGRHGQLHGVHDQRLLDAGAGGAAAGAGHGDGHGRAGAGLGPRELPGRGHVLLAGRLLGRREQ